MIANDVSQPRDLPHTIGWLGTSAAAMGGSNQMVFLVGALIAAQGSGAIPILIVGVLLGWAAAPGCYARPMPSTDVALLFDHGLPHDLGPSALAGPPLLKTS